MATWTTMRVSRETKEKLDKLKVHHRQPYEEIILSLLEVKLSSTKKPK